MGLMRTFFFEPDIKRDERHDVGCAGIKGREKRGAAPPLYERDKVNRRARRHRALPKRPSWGRAQPQTEGYTHIRPVYKPYK
jgi:hypothetical protein